MNPGIEKHYSVKMSPITLHYGPRQEVMVFGPKMIFHNLDEALKEMEEMNKKFPENIGFHWYVEGPDGYDSRKDGGNGA